MDCMASVPNIVHDAIRRHHMLVPGAPVVVAVSGGPDSLCLLHTLAGLRAALGCDLHLAHLDHMLRGAQSAAEARFVAEQAAQFGFAATIETIDVRALAAERRMNIHAAGRLARYRLFARVARTIGAQAVATAHHADDQAETVLLHLIRGAGVEGLRAIRPIVPWAEWTTFGDTPAHHMPDDPPGPALIRPLLDITRARIEAYCAEHNLAPRHDPSNDDRRYLRTRVRHDILPALAELNPRIVAALGHTAAASAAAAELTERALDEYWNNLMRKSGAELTFDGRIWAELPAALRYAALRRAYTAVGGADTFGYDDFIRAAAIIGRGVGRHVELPGNVTLTTGYNGEFSITRGAPALPGGPQLPVETLPLSVPGRIALNDGLTLCAAFDIATSPGDVWETYITLPPGNPPLATRRRRPGDRMRPAGGRGERRLQDILLDARIPRGLRAAWPIVVAGDQIAWTPGVNVAQTFKAVEGTPAIHLWIEGLTGGHHRPTGAKEHAMHDDMAKILISAEDIQRRVVALGIQITTDYQPLGDLLLVGVLKGCAMFMVDLARTIDLPLAIDFIATSSYGHTTESSGVVRMLKDLDTDIAGRHVLIVEDIIDSGLTLAYLRTHLLSRNPASLKICALLNKPDRRQADVPVDYLGFDIPNEFVVGYGLDYAERYRNLPYIGVLHERIYAYG